MLLGPPGGGKTHLAVAIGREAIDAGYTVPFVSAPSLVAQLARAHADGRLDERLLHFSKPKLLIVDELGYLPFEPDAAHLFFRFVSRRYERGSMSVTSKRSVGEWGRAFPTSVDKGTLLTVHRRTVASALRAAGRDGAPDFARYHRVLNGRAGGRGSRRACCSACLLVAAFVPSGSVVIGVDDTLERRWGKRIEARDIYRDPVRSSRGHFVKASGLHWMSPSLPAPISWVGRVRALPFLTALAPSERFARERGRTPVRPSPAPRARHARAPARHRPSLSRSVRETAEPIEGQPTLARRLTDPARAFCV